MQRLLDSKIKMMKAVDELYVAYQVRFDELAAMPATMTIFNDNRARINALIPLAEEDTTAMTKQRDALREALYISATVVTNAVKSYADSIADLVLEADMNWTVAKLRKLTFDKLGPTCTSLHERATDLLLEAGPFGLTNAKLITMKADNNAWIAKESATRNKEVAIGEYKRQVAGLVADNMGLLRKRLDPMVYSLSETDPELYALWVNTRIVEDPQTTETQLKVNVFKNEDMAPLYAVDLELVNGVVLRAKTNMEGAAEFPKPLKQGTYLFKAIKEHYRVFQIIEYRLYKGKINRLDVLLEPDA